MKKNNTAYRIDIFAGEKHKKIYFDSGRDIERFLARIKRIPGIKSLYIMKRIPAINQYNVMACRSGLNYSRLFLDTEHDTIMTLEDLRYFYDTEEQAHNYYGFTEYIEACQLKNNGILKEI